MEHPVSRESERLVILRKTKLFLFGYNGVVNTPLLPENKTLDDPRGQTIVLIMIQALAC